MVAVVSVENDALKIQRTDGSESVFQLAQGLTSSAGFDVGEKRKLKVAIGDKLLLQSNWQKKFVNGELVEVTAIQGGALVLADVRVVPEKYRAFTHGYAVNGVWTFFSRGLAEPDDASDSTLPKGDSRIAHPFKGGTVEQQSKSRRDD